MGGRRKEAKWAFPYLFFEVKKTFFFSSSVSSSLSFFSQMLLCKCEEREEGTKRVLFFSFLSPAEMENEKDLNTKSVNMSD